MPNVASPLTNSPVWKKPDEVMQLHRLKRKKRALQERMRQPSQNNSEIIRENNGTRPIDFHRYLGGEKRKNPFSKSLINQDSKKFCETQDNLNSSLDESSDSTLFQLLNLTNPKFVGAQKSSNSSDKLTSFTNLLNKYSQEQQHTVQETPPKAVDKHSIPIDWSLKTKIRFMSPHPFAWNAKLKASEEASGITGFVRCLDTSKSCTIDTSHHSRFHQHCLYWQHPNLPWINLFPRTKGKVSNRSFVAANEEIKEALHKDWTDSFRSLFQLVRARQCPFFYVCANTFTCLFQAAGIGGMVETCAFLGPTTRGLRQTLKQEEIEYSMPMSKNYTKRKSEEMGQQIGDGDKTEDSRRNSSFDSCYETMDTSTNDQSPSNSAKTDATSRTAAGGSKKNDESDDEDDIESDQWLQSLGVGEEEIKKINNSQTRKTQAVESMIDSSAESLIFVQGADAQALFNFLLNCKSSIPATGPFGGIPPTLLAPTAFHGGTLKALRVRESVVQAEGKKYYSVDLQGPILPTTVHSMCGLLQSNSNPFSATFANLQQTAAFSKAATNIMEGKNSEKTIPVVFGRENLSDCGMTEGTIDLFCSSDSSLVQTIDSLTYSDDKKAYTWS